MKNSELLGVFMIVVGTGYLLMLPLLIAVAPYNAYPSVPQCWAGLVAYGLLLEVVVGAAFVSSILQDLLKIRW